MELYSTSKSHILAVSMGTLIACTTGTFQLPAHAQTKQPTSATASAKKHYDSAVAAIDKNDWVTAQSELQAAAKLAPRNALVHYDLALAYQQNGDTASAKTELQKALDLGISAAQKEQALGLQKNLKDESIKTEKTQEASSQLAKWIGVWNGHLYQETGKGGTNQGEVRLDLGDGLLSEHIWTVTLVVYENAQTGSEYTRRAELSTSEEFRTFAPPDSRHGLWQTRNRTVSYRAVGELRLKPNDTTFGVFVVGNSECNGRSESTFFNSPSSEGPSPCESNDIDVRMAPGDEVVLRWNPTGKLNWLVHGFRLIQLSR